MYHSARLARQLPEVQPLYTHAEARFSERLVSCVSTVFPCPMCHEALGSPREKGEVRQLQIEHGLTKAALRHNFFPCQGQPPLDDARSLPPKAESPGFERMQS